MLLRDLRHVPLRARQPDRELVPEAERGVVPAVEGDRPDGEARPCRERSTDQAPRQRGRQLGLVHRLLARLVGGPRGHAIHVPAPVETLRAGCPIGGRELRGGVQLLGREQHDHARLSPAGCRHEDGRGGDRLG